MSSPVSLPPDACSGTDPDDSDVSLPPDVASSEADAGAASSVAELPPPEGSLQTKCRCKRGCVGLLRRCVGAAAFSHGNA